MRGEGREEGRDQCWADSSFQIFMNPIPSYATFNSLRMLRNHDSLLRKRRHRWPMLHLAQAAPVARSVTGNVHLCGDDRSHRAHHLSSSVRRSAGIANPSADPQGVTLFLSLSLSLSLVIDPSSNPEGPEASRCDGVLSTTVKVVRAERVMDA